MALVAAKQDPHSWVKNASPIDYIRNNLNESLGKMGTADYARTILALIASNENPENFSGIDLVSMLKSKVKPDGQIGDFIYTTIWGIIALKACNEDVTKSVEWLKQQQNADGGFAWAVGEESDYDDTAAAIQALMAAGEPRDSEVTRRALDYLKTGQNADGGFRYFGSSASNAASDAWVIQALVAAGENPLEWRRNNISVVEHLLSLQTEEGYFNYTSIQTSNPGYMTICAIMALLGKYHPIKVLDLKMGYVNENQNLTFISTQIPVKAVATPTITTASKEASPAPTSQPKLEPSGKILSIAIFLALISILAAVMRRRR
jgi:hypothetical protein